MKKIETLMKLQNSGVIAVLRAESKEKAAKIIDAIVTGGMKGIEITFTVPNAEQLIKETMERYKDCKDLVIGAGTVLDSVSARLAIMAGAEFVVSPYFDKEAAKLCHLYQIPYLPGCMTVNEMKDALSYGIDIIKLFPGNLYGPNIIDAIKAPLPQVNIMPTGGVNLDNLHAWLEKGCVAVGVGNSLYAPAEQGDYRQISILANQYMEKFRQIKQVNI